MDCSLSRAGRNRALFEAILRTLAYADVFDFPLTAKEIWKYLISDKKVSFWAVKKRLWQAEDLIESKGKYFFLKNREKIVKIRKNRQKWSEKKLEIARRVAGWLRLIPWIKMVGVTGALAMKNSDKNDDIDILIVTSQNRLWLTRLLTVLLVELVAHRRRPGDKIVRDKICLNMFLDENHLAVPKNEQDLFSAHEVCQLKPILDKNRTYQKFLRENQWVKKYLPNGIDIDNEDIKGNKKRTPNYLISQLLNFFENLAYKFQLAHMKPRKTSEITDPGRIRFHPQDCRERILKKYEKNSKNFNFILP